MPSLGTDFFSALTTAMTKNAAMAAMIIRPPSASNQRCLELGSIQIATAGLRDGARLVEIKLIDSVPLFKAFQKGHLLTVQGRPFQRNLRSN